MSIKHYARTMLYCLPKGGDRFLYTSMLPYFLSQTIGLVVIPTHISTSLGISRAKRSPSIRNSTVLSLV